jgi:aminoglycoside 2''-phosphotransferase
MPSTQEILLQRIQTLMPDITVEHFEINQEGLINDVVIVNRNLVFRFAKNDECAKVLKAELNILDLVRSQISLDVPTPILHQPGSVVYPFLEGQPFLRGTLLSLDPIVQSQTAHQLGKFLYELHSIPLSGLDDELPKTLAPVTRERWLDIRRRASEKVYPFLLPHQKQWAEKLFDSVLSDPALFDYAPALIHGDLAPYHILFNGNRITGVIDFGVAGIGDPALDLGSLISSYGESFVSQMGAEYPELNAILPRARFYAQSIEIQWVLLGIETGETFWFTTHLGGARDVQE